jgi:hypothetical protein
MHGTTIKIIKFDVKEKLYEGMYYTNLPEKMVQWLSIANVVMKVLIHCEIGVSQVTSKERLLHYFVVYSSPTQVLIHLTLKDVNDRKSVDTSAI